MLSVSAVISESSIIPISFPSNKTVVTVSGLIIKNPDIQTAESKTKRRTHVINNRLFLFFMYFLLCLNFIYKFSGKLI